MNIRKRAFSIFIILIFSFNLYNFVLAVEVMITPKSYGIDRARNEIMIKNDSPECWMQALTVTEYLLKDNWEKNTAKNSVSSIGGNFCASMGRTEKKVLALELTKCFLNESGRKSIPKECHSDFISVHEPYDRIQECLAQLSAADLDIYAKYLLHNDETCERLSGDLLITRVERIRHSVTDYIIKEQNEIKNDMILNMQRMESYLESRMDSSIAKQEEALESNFKIMMNLFEKSILDQHQQIQTESFGSLRSFIDDLKNETTRSLNKLQETLKNNIVEEQKYVQSEGLQTLAKQKMLFEEQQKILSQVKEFHERSSGVNIINGLLHKVKGCISSNFFMKISWTWKRLLLWRRFIVLLLCIVFLTSCSKRLRKCRSYIILLALSEFTIENIIMARFINDIDVDLVISNIRSFDIPIYIIIASKSFIRSFRTPMIHEENKVANKERREDDLTVMIELMKRQLEQEKYERLQYMNMMNMQIEAIRRQQEVRNVNSNIHSNQNVDILDNHTITSVDPNLNYFPQDRLLIRYDENQICCQNNSYKSEEIQYIQRQEENIPENSMNIKKRKCTKDEEDSDTDIDSYDDVDTYSPKKLKVK